LKAEKKIDSENLDDLKKLYEKFIARMADNTEAEVDQDVALYKKTHQGWC
jgi:hypothetical protein